VAARLVAQADALKLAGRRISGERLHLTLAFLGAVNADVMQQLCASAADIRAPAFTLRLDQVGYFARPGIAWFGPSHVPTALTQLSSAVAALAPEHSRHLSFQAHVSIARAVPRPSLQARITPIDWPVREFCLFESGHGGRAGAYRCVGCWSLWS